MGTGKVGGNITSYYTVRIKSAGSAMPLNTVIYDFSGSSYHYNADYGTGPTITTTPAPSPDDTSVTFGFTLNIETLSFYFHVLRSP